MPRSSIRPVDNVTIWMLDDPDLLRNAVKQSVGALSGYVHPSRKAFEKRLARADRGEFSGFEGPAVLEAFNQLASQTLDLAVVMNLPGHWAKLHGRPLHSRVR